MTDTYTQLVNNPIGSFIADNVGLPKPVELDRYVEGAPLIDGRVLVGSRRGGTPRPGRRRGARRRGGRGRQPAWRSRPRRARRGDDRRRCLEPRGAERPPLEGLVFDAIGIGSSADLRELWSFFHPTIRSLHAVRPPDRARARPRRTAPIRRRPPRSARSRASSAPRARRFATAAPPSSSTSSPGAEGQVGSSLRFFLSPRSAYVSGQVARIGAGRDVPRRRPLQPAPRQGRARHRGLARDRRVDRRRPRPRRGPRRRPRRSRAEGRPRAGRRRDRRHRP